MRSEIGDDALGRTWVLLCAGLLLAGCTVDVGGNGNVNDNAPMATNDTGATVWDFRIPLTTLELGSQFDEVLELDGPLDLEVIFPSGRTIVGTWDRGAFADAPAVVGGDQPEPVRRVSLIEDEADSVAEVRASAERFTAEFGPARRGDDQMTIEEWLDDFETIVVANGETISPRGHGDGADGNGSTIRGFEAAPQDGITPGWLVRVVDGGVTIRTVISFEPAPDP